MTRHHASTMSSSASSPRTRIAPPTFGVTWGLSSKRSRLAEEGLRVLLDWSAGIEIVSPTAEPGTETARFCEFLEARRGRVFSRRDDPNVETPIAGAERHGASVRYQQHREDGGYFLDEADLTPILGMPVTLLATNRPG